jgi:hypothetical protein
MEIRHDGVLRQGMTSVVPTGRFILVITSGL